MKGWEIYQKDWGCGDWNEEDDYFFDTYWCWFNRIWLDIGTPWSWLGSSLRLNIHYTRQPTLVQVLVDERRLRCQIKLMQDQWRRALYDPTRAVCKKRIEAEFRDLSEEDRFGCNDV